MATLFSSRQHEAEDSNNIDPGIADSETGAINRREAMVLTGAALGATILSKPDTAEAVEKSNEELKERLFDEPKLSAPEGNINRQLMERWRRNYLGLDPVQIRLKQKGLRRNNDRLADGWNRIQANEHLEMVYNACLEVGVPFELVFVAMAESHWTNTARSRAGAVGPWQFMPATAREMGLRVSRSVDERTDWVKSTYAALKYLKKLYLMTFRWDRKIRGGSHSPNANDRWQFAMWAYNHGPGNVRRHYIRTQGNPALYQSVCGNRESENYVPKIWGIRAALSEMEQFGTVPSAVSQVAEKIDGKTQGDILYEIFSVNKSRLTLEVKRIQLDMISARYTNEKERGIITEKYFQGAMRVIEEQIREIEAEVVADDQQVTSADQAFEAYLIEKDALSPRDTLDKLKEIEGMYQEDLAENRHTETYVESALTVINQEIKGILNENPELVTKSVEADHTSIYVSLDDRGDIEATVRPKDTKVEEAQEVPTVTYRILPGDNIFKISVRLAGSPEKISVVRALIESLNPEIKDINKVQRYQEIKVPGEYIIVPRVKLGEIIDTYYPGYSDNEETAKGYLKLLNGRKPTDRILVGDTILVPSIQ